MKPKTLVPRFRAGPLSGPREGVAVLELALLMPMLTVLLLGVLEVSQAMRVTQILTEASRNGSAIASQPGKTNSDVMSEVKTVLTNSGLNPQNATVTILINDTQGGLGNANRNDKITVVVAIPWSSVNYSRTNYFFGKTMLVESTTMLKLVGIANRSMGSYLV